jgi:hypothetical protein
MVDMSISDSDETAKKAANTTQPEPTTSKPGAERDPLADLENPDASVTPALPDTDHAAAEREMLSALQRAASAAERLKELSPEQEDLDPSPERDEGPPSGPTFPTPLPPPFAITSNGQLLLNVEACPELKLEGRAIFRGIALSEEEAAYAFRKIENTIHDAAGQLGGMIKRREIQGSGGDDTT